MTDTDDLTEIEALARKATPGEWRATKFSSVVGCPITTQPDPTKNTVVIAGVHGAFGADYRAEAEANAAHIAHMSPARTLRIVERLREAEGPAAAMERRIGNYVYRRIAALLEATPGTPAGGELCYLVDVVEHLEDLEDVGGDKSLSGVFEGLHAANSRATAAEARVEVLEGLLTEAGEVVAPFAEAAANIPADVEDFKLVASVPGGHNAAEFSKMRDRLTAGVFRAARALAAKLEGRGDE